MPPTPNGAQTNSPTFDDTLNTVHDKPPEAQTPQSQTQGRQCDAEIHLRNADLEALTRAAEAALLAEALRRARQDGAQRREQIRDLRHQLARQQESLQELRRRLDGDGAGRGAGESSPSRGENATRRILQEAAARLLDQADLRTASYQAALAMMRVAATQTQTRLAGERSSQELALQGQRDELEARHAAEIARLRARIEEGQQELRHAHEQRRALDTQLRRAQAAARTCAEEQARADRLAEQLETAEINLAGIAEVVRSETVRRELLQQQLASLKAEKEQLEAEKEQLEAEKEQLEARVRDLRARADEQREEPQFEGLKMRIVELAAGQQEARRGQAEALRQIEQLRSQIAASKLQLVAQRRAQTVAFERILAELAEATAARVDAERLAVVLSQELAIGRGRSPGHA